MPRVPTLDRPQVAQSGLPQAQVSQPSMPDVAGQQAQQLGQTLGRAGQQLGRVAQDVAQQANQLRVDDALNKVKEQSLRLTYDKDAGYTNLRGVNALERPDGKPLADEYGETLQKYVDEVGATLGNDAQRAAFSANARGILTNFRGNIIKHEADEFRTYALSVSEGVQSTALREIALSWNNPEAIDKAVRRIGAETYRQGQLLGKSAEWQEAQARKMTSEAHRTALAAALENNDVIYADGYLAKYKGQMEADDILRVRGLITKEMDLQVGTSLGAQTFAQFAPRLQPSEFDRLANVAQVDGEGREQMGQLLQRYDGDIGKTLAAQRLGEGEVDKLVKAHGAAWLDHAPAGTRQAVEAQAAEFGNGAGRPAKPTLAEMKAALRERPELMGNPARLKHAEDRLEADYKAYTDAMKQREEEALDRTYRELFANGGDFAALPASLRAEIPGDKMSSTLDFARTVASGKYVQDARAWAQINSLPERELAAMSPAEFYRRYRPVLDDAHLEKGYALLEAANKAVGKADSDPDGKHLEIITTANRVKQAAQQANIIPAEGKPDDEQVLKFAEFQQMVDDRVRQFEQVDLQGKRKANSAELQQILDGVILDKAFVPRTLWFDKEQPVALMSPEAQARAYVTVDGQDVTLAAIPTGQRATIVSKLRARGLPVTEQAIAELWVRAGQPK